MTNFLHSRFTLFLAIIIAAACAWVCATFAPETALHGSPGLIAAWSAPWHISTRTDLWIAVAANALAAIIIAYLNKAFNLLRSLTWLAGSLFLFMQLAVPGAVTALSPGIIVCLATAICLFILFSSYDAPECERAVFTIFLLLSLLLSIDWSALVLIPVFWLGCGQMRIFSLRTLTASILGIATPWIILLGFNIVSISEIAVTNPFGWPRSMSQLSLPGPLGVAIFTIFLAMCAWIQGFMKLITYNAKTRSMMGMVTLIMIVSMVYSIAALKNIGSWLPVLNCCASLHVAHLFGAVFRQKKSFIAILAIMAIYLIFFLWELASSML